MSMRYITRSVSSTAFLEPNSTCRTPPMALGRLKVDSSSLYAPLLDGSATSAVISEDIPVLSLDDSVENDEMNSGNLEQDVEANGQFGIVLVHGFGGGVFSWRHVMGALARQIGCTVAAFDRPGWGLTSRRHQKDWEEKELHNPYKLEAQVDLLLAFCSEMGFSSVVLVGHDDGGLLALKAAQRVHFHKVPRSPTPAGKTPKSDSEMRRKPLGAARDEGELPVGLLADIDSLFLTLQGLTVHYKLCLPGSPPRSLSSTAFLEPNSTCSTPPMALGRLKVDRQALSLFSKTQYQHLHRSYSNQFHSSSLYAPLLDGPATSAVISEDIPVLSLDDSVENDEMNSGNLEQDVEANGQFGIVLVHGFGGGVFSWRHVMGVLARQIGCTVAAFDRPGWGLISRSRQKDCEEKELHNPYKLEAQVDLLLAFCSEMGFSSVVLVGHDDGGLLALKAAQRVQLMKTDNVSFLSFFFQLHLHQLA
ncbi:hypothetical protein LWI29_007699 [Acer saccharum]|uniref:AB hydrolase-1 domain-containing protein n=1 Tax=Acer saccharum TaxID=4024 RepID=A0AA39SUH0_ACESA|nr:hypothetical protein LWI29_007699 [Acer saccharum]